MKPCSVLLKYIKPSQWLSPCLKTPTKYSYSSNARAIKPFHDWSSDEVAYRLTLDMGFNQHTLKEMMELRFSAATLLAIAFKIRDYGVYSAIENTWNGYPLSKDVCEKIVHWVKDNIVSPSLHRFILGHVQRMDLDEEGCERLMGHYQANSNNQENMDHHVQDVMSLVEQSAATNTIPFISGGSSRLMAHVGWEMFKKSEGLSFPLFISFEGETGITSDMTAQALYARMIYSFIKTLGGSVKFSEVEQFLEHSSAPIDMQVIIDHFNQVLGRDDVKYVLTVGQISGPEKDRCLEEVIGLVAKHVETSPTRSLLPFFSCTNLSVIDTYLEAVGGVKGKYVVLKPNK